MLGFKTADPKVVLPKWLERAFDFKKTKVEVDPFTRTREITWAGEVLF